METMRALQTPAQDYTVLRSNKVSNNQKDKIL
jgi:hypothetical protein